MTIKIKLYQSIFEVEFIKSSDKLYAIEGESLLQKLEIPDYLKHVEKRFNEGIYLPSLIIIVMIHSF
jgi:cullin-4